MHIQITRILTTGSMLHFVMSGHKLSVLFPHHVRLLQLIAGRNEEFRLFSPELVL